MNSVKKPVLEDQTRLQNVRLKLFFESLKDEAEDSGIQESHPPEEDHLGETVIFSHSPKEVPFSPTSLLGKRIRRLNKFKTPSQQVGRLKLQPNSILQTNNTENRLTLKRRGLYENSTLRKRAKNVLETWMKPYQQCIECCMDLLNARFELSNELEPRPEGTTSRDKNVVPMHVLQAALAKYNRHMSDKLSDIGLDKQLRHFLYTQDEIHMEKDTDSKAFWKECTRNINTSPPKECPVELGADREHYERYTASVERIVDFQKKNANLFDAVAAFKKYKAISTDLSKLSKKNSSWARLQKTKDRKEEVRHGVMETLRAVYNNLGSAPNSFSR